MPRLNGKFVSKAVFEAAMNDNQEETTMSEYSDTDAPATDVADETEVKVDRRSGPRPGTALKRARLDLVKAQSKADEARRKLNAYNADVQALNDAVDAADAVVADAESAVADLVDAL